MELLAFLALMAMGIFSWKTLIRLEAEEREGQNKK